MIREVSKQIIGNPTAANIFNALMVVIDSKTNNLPVNQLISVMARQL